MNREYNAVLQRVVSLWEEMFHRDVIAADDNFFELGGDSLLGLAMSERLGAILQVPVSLSDLLLAPTPRALTSRVMLGETCADDAIVPMSPVAYAQNSDHALYLIHPIGGGATPYADLASKVDPHWRVFAFQSPSLEHDIEPLESIEEMAGHYAAELGVHHGDMPFVIAGWSFGAFIAFEMACCLDKVGCRPDGVVLIDPQPTRSEFPDDPIHRQREVERLVSELWKVSIEPDTYRRLAWDDLVDYVIGCAVDQGRLPVDTDRRAMRRSMALYSANARALRAYKPSRSYSGSMLIFCAGGIVSVNGMLSYWRSLVLGDLDIQEITGGHGDLLIEPNLGPVVVRINILLNSLVMRS
jgi:thioesterase domain-containing protein